MRGPLHGQPLDADSLAQPDAFIAQPAQWEPEVLNLIASQATQLIIDRISKLKQTGFGIMAKKFSKIRKFIITSYSGDTPEEVGSAWLENDRVVFSSTATQKLCESVAFDSVGPVPVNEPWRFLQTLPASLSGSMLRASLIADYSKNPSLPSVHLRPSAV